jgi:hypothetical protein
MHRTEETVAACPYRALQTLTNIVQSYDAVSIDDLSLADHAAMIEALGVLQALAPRQDHVIRSFTQGFQEPDDERRSVKLQNALDAIRRVLPKRVW